MGTGDPQDPASEGKPDDSTLEFYKEESGWFEKVTKLKRYFRTRSSIIDGDNLFDLSDSELQKRDLMSPLRFNTYQTALSAGPTLAILWLASLWQPAEKLPSSLIPLLSFVLTLKPATAAAFVEIYPKLHDVVDPFITPTVLLIGSWVYALVSLKREDMNRANRRRAMRAHLYFDGTYGLYTEALAVFIATVAIPHLPSWDMPTVPGLVWFYFYWGYAALYQAQNPRSVLRIFGYQSVQDANSDEIITIYNSGPELKEYSGIRRFFGGALTGLACVICNGISHVVLILSALLLSDIAVALKVNHI